ncbi:MAG: glycosyltransferase [Chitinivibrionales bacterium]|nr:glycosyltransferase [Chitinivibrionales bacterium]
MHSLCQAGGFMKILWDFRLYSYGYAARGVGIYTQRMCEAILKHDPGLEIAVWANKRVVPRFMHEWNVHWIPYTKGSWRSDLITIPGLMRKHAIDIVTFWVVLGPIWHIGLGLFHPCKVICVIHDMGVELWDAAAQNLSLRKSWYWKTQKLLASQSDHIVCNSCTTKKDLRTCLPAYRRGIQVLYPPMPAYLNRSVRRERFFLALGGQAHKNLQRVIEAFALFRDRHADYRLVVCGEVQTSIIIPRRAQPQIVFESMERYELYLSTCRAFIFCSLYEGLGLPPVEALASGCPVIAGDIPVLHETLHDGAVYVNPESVDHIAQGMHTVADVANVWQDKATIAGRLYKEQTAHTAQHWCSLYQSLGGRK